MPTARAEESDDVMRQPTDTRTTGTDAVHAAAPRGIEAPLVDAHAHVFDDGMPLSDTAWHTPPAPATVEDYLAELDAAGIHFAVLAAASIFADYNDYTLEALRRHRRLRATAIVSPDIDPSILREMDRDGIVGIRLQFRNVDAPPDLTSFAYRKLFRRIADLGWHVHLHDEGERLPQFIEAIEGSGPRLVIDHFGRPAAGDPMQSESFRAILNAAERGRTWIKLSAGFRLEGDLSRSVAEALLREVGTERLLWGSDWPFASFETSMSYDKALGSYAACVPEPRDRAAIDRTALALYFS